MLNEELKATAALMGMTEAELVKAMREAELVSKVTLEMHRWLMDSKPKKRRKAKSDAS